MNIKSIVYLAGLFLISASLSAQNAAHFGITNIDILYTNLKTIININPDTHTGQQLNLVTNKGELTQISPYSYSLQTKDTGKLDLMLYVNNQLTATKSYTVRNAPAPKAVIKGKNGISAYISELHEIEAISHLPFDLQYRIISYSISVFNSSHLIEKHFKGNRITQEAKEFMSNVPVGEKIYFENIQCIGLDGKLHTLPGIVILKDGAIGIVSIESNNTEKKVYKEGYIHPGQDKIKSLCVCRFSDMQTNDTCRISSFICSYIVDGIKKETRITLQKIDQINKLISQLADNTQLTFSDIQAKDQNGQPIQIANITLTVKQL